MRGDGAVAYCLSCGGANGQHKNDCQYHPSNRRTARKVAKSKAPKKPKK